MVRAVTTANENVITPHRIKLRSSPDSELVGAILEDNAQMSPARVRPSRKYRRRKRLSPKKTENGVSESKKSQGQEQITINGSFHEEISEQSTVEKYLEVKYNGLSEKDVFASDYANGNGYADVCASDYPYENDYVNDMPKKKTTRRRALKNANINSPRTRAKAVKTGHRGSDSHKLTEYFNVDKSVNSLMAPTVLAKTLKSPVKPNHKLTEYYPVRRSVRKTSKCVQAERLKDLEMAVREQREEGLEVCVFDGKGRGVVSTRLFRRGDFVVEYSGVLVDSLEAKKREDMYSRDPKAGCYMYYFKHGNRQYCIDATAESGRLGRLVNHSRNGNLSTKVVFVDGLPHLVLLASQDIGPGEELTYDYGDRSKESLIHHPWLAL